MQRPVGTVVDFVDLIDYASKHAASDLVQRRVNGAVLQQRIADGEKVPGVKLEFIAQLSLTKVST